MSDPEPTPPASAWIIRPDELHIEDDAQIGGRQIVRGRWRNSLVVVKILSEQAEPSALHARGELWPSLRHANVLQTFGISSLDADPLYVVTEFQSTGNVTRFLQQNPKADRAKIVIDAALGMQFLHGRGVVHGSLKPTNILIREDRRACVSDYGMIELQTSGGSGHRYFSPEAWKGTISRPSDVFAWAMCALEIFTSKAPWGILSEKQIFRLVVQQDSHPDRPDEDFGLTDHIWDTMEKCWHRDARRRPTFDILVQLLQATSASKRQSSEILGRTSSDSRVEETRGNSRAFSMRSRISVPPAYESTTHPGSAPPTISKFRVMNHSSPSTPPELPPHPPRPQYSDRGSDTGSLLSADHSSADEEGRRSASPFNNGSATASQDRRWRAPSPSLRTSSSGRSSRSGTSWTSASGSSRSAPLRLRSIGESLPDTPSVIPSYFDMPSAALSEPIYEKHRALTARSAPSEYSESTVSLHHHAPTPSILSQPSSVGTATGKFATSDRSSASIDSLPALNANLLVGALATEVKEGRNRDVIDPLLSTIQELGLKSDKDAQKLVTAGAIPTLTLLMKTRAVDGIGLETVLLTLGILTYVSCIRNQTATLTQRRIRHDPISANTIFRTNSTATLIEIVNAAQTENIAALAVWCLARICRNTEIASGLVKQNLGKLLVTKGLRAGWRTARIAAWCLGALIRSDAIADMLADIGVVPSLCEHVWRCSQAVNASPEDYSAAIYAVARISRSVKIAKALAKGGCVEMLAHCLNTSEDPSVLLWSARAVGCLMRPNSSDMAKLLLDAGVARGLARLPSVLPTEEVEPLGAFAFAIQRFSCAEWGGGTRKALVDAGVVDALLAALRTAADEPHLDVHIELANAIALLGDVGGTSIRKEIVNAGGIDILKRVGSLAIRADVTKACNQAATSITGNVWSRNAASAKAALAHEWSGGCPDYLPGCPIPTEEEEQWVTD